MVSEAGWPRAGRGSSNSTRPARPERASTSVLESAQGTIVGSARFGSTRLCPSLLGSTRLFSAPLGSARLCLALPGSARLCPALPSSSRFLSAVPGSSRLL